RGSHIEVSLFDALADWMAIPLLWHDYGGKAPERVGLAHPSICPYGAFKTSDGKIILLSIQNEREWKRFCADILEDTDYYAKFPDNSTRVKNRKEVDDLVDQVIGRMSHAEVAARMKKAEIAFGTLNEVQDFSNHPVLRRAVIPMAAAEIKIPAPPAIFNYNPTEFLGNVPELNQHGEEIRAEFA
ncbi:MAG: CoA transferase, partial [SAR324 cluster bacterium]|nr:CoA transferase [SAR324 cluster bacterium]